MAVRAENEQQSAEEQRLRNRQFTLFTLAVAVFTGAFAVMDIVTAATRGSQIFYALAAQAAVLGLVGLISALWARSGRISTAVQFWVLGSSIYMASTPFLATGLLPFGIMGTIINVIVVAVFMSPRLVRRAATLLVIIAAFSSVLESPALGRWMPWQRVNEMADAPFIPIALNLVSFAFAAYLINFLGSTLLRAVESSQTYASQLEQNQSALLERTALLEDTMANLRLRSEELERLNLNWQVTSQQAERRAAQLAASSQVAHAIGQVRDLDQLLSQVTQFISRAFEYYHVGVFIVDEINEFAVLRAASSDGGQRMLERGHKLAVGKQGIVGYVTGTGQPRIALDVGADAIHFDNPDLPQTRSEMALPLHVGNQVFGALDVQSAQEAAFTEDDVAVLSTLADQIAVAIENARLFSQTRVALQEAQEVQQRYQRQEWERLAPLLLATGHEYRVSGVPSVGDMSLPEIEQVIQQGDVAIVKGDGNLLAGTALAVPIKLRDQLIGVIDLHEVDPEHEWTDDDVALVTAVADQAALALENARLFAQTQRRAQREQLIAQVATHVRAAPDVDGVLRTAVHEVRRALGASHGIIRLGVMKEKEEE